jgi:DNA (cytosine-5)-methyltransferase 1
MVASGRPYVIENVDAPAPRAELVDPIRLCGRSFPGLRVYRHRLFELGGGLEGVVPEPEHRPHDVLCHTLDKRKAHYGKTDEMINFVQVNGGGNSSVVAARDAMGVNHRPDLTKHELNEGIPPAYTAYIARHAAAFLSRVVAA